MRILLVDDEATVRQAIRRVLADIFPNPMFGEAATPTQARELARRVRWDVIIGTSSADLIDLESDVPSVCAVLDHPETLVAAVRAITASNRPDPTGEDDQATDPLWPPRDPEDG